MVQSRNIFFLVSGFAVITIFSLTFSRPFDFCVKEYVVSPNDSLKSIQVDHERNVQPFQLASSADLQSNKQPFQMAPFVFPQLYSCAMKIEDQPQANEYGSQSHEEIWLYDKIFSKSPDIFGGTFIEIGALDGRTYSNTVYFEKKWDWRGILIEGHPGNQAALRANQNYRKNSAIFTVAVCNLTMEGEYDELLFTRGGGAIGASTVHANPTFLQAWHGGQDNGNTNVTHILHIPQLICICLSCRWSENCMSPAPKNYRINWAI